MRSAFRPTLTWLTALALALPMPARAEPRTPLIEAADSAWEESVSSFETEVRRETARALRDGGGLSRFHAGGVQTTVPLVYVAPADRQRILSTPDEAWSDRFAEAWNTQVRHWPSDAVETLTSPGGWDTGDWIFAGGVIAGTAVLFAFDGEIRGWINDHHNETLASITETATRSEVFAGTLAAVTVGGFLFGDRRLRRAAVESLEAITITSLLIRTPVSSLLGRARPTVSDDPYDFAGPSFTHRLDGDNTSFFSGHASAYFATAAVFAETYADEPVVPVLAYGLATLLTLSRGYNWDKSHWPSDLFFGAAIGYATGKFVHWLNLERFTRLRVAPYSDFSTGGGLSVGGTF